MKVVLDACVLFPNVMREMLLGAARSGAYQPLWSDRILEEWRRAAEKLGPVCAAQAGGEIALLRAAWPRALIAPSAALEARLWLPDPADVHVLASAVAASADAIVTMNRKDFPQETLREEGLDRLDPDGFLLSLWHRDPDRIGSVGQGVLAEARRMDPKWEMRPLLKRARLPRLAKALETETR